MSSVYLSLGGNIGDSSSIFFAALDCLSLVKGIEGLRCSPFYSTTPVSPIPQPNFLNAVCQFNTCLTAKELLIELQKIERQFGKAPKPKEAPRPIDLDILFFGLEYHQTEELQIPHPRWMERLFVLIPLATLARYLTFPKNQNEFVTVDISDLANSFPTSYNQQVELLRNEVGYASSAR